MGKSVTLIGAGLVGSLLSIYLSKRGYKVTVYERRPDLRKNRISAGRSINLALSDRGWRGLERVGIGEDIKKVALPMPGRIIHHQDRSIVTQPYGKDGQAIWSVSRGGLNCVLMDLAEQHGVKIHYNERCTNVDLDSATAHFENTETHVKSVVQNDVIFSTDGAFSAGRLQMQLTTDRFDYAQKYLQHGYKELTIPPTANGDFAMDPKGLHIWPRGQFMLIALPNMDKSFTCTLFFPFEGEVSFASLNTEQKMLDFFMKTFPDAVDLMPALKEEYFANPTSSLSIVKCWPWTYKNKFAMVGDSAHAIVPFYGQGMNCGFEDCVVMDDYMSQFGDDLEKVFKAYELSRKPDGDAIADLAVANFVEMCDRTADPKFLLQKKIEAWFSEKHPDKWIPLYTMVTFRPDIRYSTALNEGNKQEAVMQRVMREIPNIEQNWNSPEVEQAILAQLAG